MRLRHTISALTLSAVGLLAIANFEGYSDVVYEPVRGDVPTVGFGHADKNLRVGDRINPLTGLEYLAQDLKDAEDAVKACVTVPLTQNEFDAYVSFVYNVGRTAFCSSTLVKKLNRGDYRGACEELPRWVYFKGKPLKGLQNRREEERDRCVR